MGYTTTFTGHITIKPALDDETKAFLLALTNTRRMARNFPESEGYGVEGEFYVKGSGYKGQDDEESIIDSNRPPRTQPSLWCQWTVNDEGTQLVWDGGEKFYYYLEWMEYIINNILGPKGHLLNGRIDWQGEDRHDHGILQVDGNVVTSIGGE